VIFEPIPVVFEPILKPKPWGGRRLAQLFDKRLPGDAPIGESWELSDLPGSESRVVRGPLAGKRVGELIEMWGHGLIGKAELVGGRFPLLIKFLDARERLSVQVHASSLMEDLQDEPPAVKHEAWYVVDAEPGGVVFIGCKPGVGPDDVRRATPTAALADLLCRRPADPGCCYYLPSGVPHALGAGVVVAEVQTPSDVTYRLYDWERVGLDGRPRDLHIEQALANLRCDIPQEQIVQPRSRSGAAFAVGAARLIACDRFVIDKVRLAQGPALGLEQAEMAMWIILTGHGALVREQYQCDFRPGDVVLIPAESAGTRFETAGDCELLEVTIPSSGDTPGCRRPT
jgi:mannose-6-phosphate isomerase